VKLDVGCGEDKHGDVGVDVRRTGAVTVLADCYSLPFRDESFDEVESVTLLEHCLNPFNALKDQVRVLRKGGRLRCTTDYAGYWRYNIKHIFVQQYHPCHFKSRNDGYNPSETHYMIFYPENVEKMFKLLRLKDVTWFYKKKPWKRIDRLLRSVPLFKENTYSRFIVEGWK